MYVLKQGEMRKYGNYSSIKSDWRIRSI